MQTTFIPAGLSIQSHCKIDVTSQPVSKKEEMDELSLYQLRSSGVFDVQSYKINVLYTLNHSCIFNFSMKGALIYCCI